MKYVTVQWLHSPRRDYGIPRAAGAKSRLPSGLLKNIDEKFYVVIEESKKERPVRVKDTQARKPRTRPVNRGTKDS